MAEAARQIEPDDGLTPGERAYMQSGGDTAGLVKEGVQITDAPAIPAPDAEAAPLTPAVPAASPAGEEEEEEDPQPDLDTKTGRPKQRGQWVSKKALDAERAQAKQLRSELGTTKEQWARLEERFKVFQEAMTATEPDAAAEPEAPMPDPEQDIFGAFKWQQNRLGQLEKSLTNLNGNLGQMRDMSQSERQTMQLVNEYRNDAAAFAQRQPDFGQAYQYLLVNRHAELEAAGYVDVNQRNQLIMADEQALAHKAFTDRTSPAERIYALAKARGYKLAPATASAPQPNGNGAAAPAPAAAAGKPSATEEIARIQAGQNAAMSLSNVGGNRPNNLSIQDLISMPMDEFRAFAAKNPGLLEQMAGKG